MEKQDKTVCDQILDVIGNQSKSAIGITSSPSTTLDLTIDITEECKSERALGQMVYVIIEEDGRNVLVMGQIISIRTENRWHEDPSFKGVIKRHGKLPHLSGAADNRIATLSVQACYDLRESEPKGYILGTSPSTGEKVKKMNNEVMNALMKHHEKDITYIGKVYGTDVNLPFWFKHFDKTNKAELGAGDAYHIGVFGKTGSGKTVTATYMLLGYAKNKNNMNILVLDPKGQFYIDTELLPKSKLKEAIEKIGMKYYKYKILEDLYLPTDAYDLLGSLLQKSSFIKKSFNILSDREANAAEAISIYIENLMENSKGKYGNLKHMWDDKESFALMEMTLKKFIETEDIVNKKGKKDIRYNKYIDMIYSQPARKDQLIDTLTAVLNNKTRLNEIFNNYWKPVANLFAEKKADKKDKKSIESIIDLVTTEDTKGNFVILDLSEKGGREISENLQAMFVKIIESKIKAKGEKFYEQGKKVNCLVVMDEAHRFIAKESSDPQITELTSEIIDSVRTTRKYGIGYMFITQTIESLDMEIWDQIRMFAFGYGLTSGPALKRINDLINNSSAINLYRSFIDPASNNRFPFMFFGPVSPLSFTGSPLFIEVYSDPKQFK
jgi:hypothetical protein